MSDPSAGQQWHPLPSFQPIAEAISFLEQTSAMRTLQYSLNGTLDADTLELSVKADLTAQMTQEVERLPLVLSSGLRVIDASVDDEPSAVERSGDRLWLTLESARSAGSTVTCALSYEGRLPFAYVLREESGIWAELAPQAFWYPFAFWDATSAIPFEVSLDLPGGLIAVSNGSTQEEEHGVSGTRYVWSNPGDAPSIAVLAGPYATQQTARGSVAIRTFMRPDMADQVDDIAATVDRITAVYVERFGPTSVDEITVIVPPHSVGGNWALPRMIVAGQLSPASTHERRFNILAHEMAHQWWGHAVRFDFASSLWLAEGLTSFSGLSAHLRLEGEPATRDHLVTWTLPRYTAAREAAVALADCRTDSPRSQEVREDASAVFLALLRSHVGPAEFDRRLRSFFEGYAGRGATSDAFVEAIIADSPESLGRFVHTWLYSVPLPEVTADDVIAGLGCG